MKNLRFGFAIVSVCASFFVNAQDDGSRQAAVTCYKELHESADAKTLEPKLPIDVEKASGLDVLSNKLKISKGEKPALLRLVNQWGECVRLGNVVRAKSLPGDMVAVYEEYWTVTKSLLADLYAGSITYGDVSKKRVSLEQEYGNKLQSLAAFYKAQYEQQAAQAKREAEQREAEKQQREAQAEAYRRQQAAEAEQTAMLRKLQKQRQAEAEMNMGLQLLQMGRPQMAPISPINSFNCRSSTYGGITNTNCN